MTIHYHGDRCGWEGCAAPVYARGACAAHYRLNELRGVYRLADNPADRGTADVGDRGAATCLRKGCDRPLFADGLCTECRQEARAYGFDPEKLHVATLAEIRDLPEADPRTLPEAAR